MATDKGFFFHPGATYDICIFKDTTLDEDGEPLATGKLTLGESVFADTNVLNENPLPDPGDRTILSTSSRGTYSVDFH